MIRSIVSFGDPRLLAPNEPVTTYDAELASLVRDLVETCHAAPGLGLAAPQIGVNRRVAVVDLSVGTDPSQVFVLVNPRIVESEGEVRSEEGCLSVPGFEAPIVRPERVVVEAEDETGRRRRLAGENLLARALCHETGHLDSRLYLDELRGLQREMLLRKVRRRFTS